MSIFILLQKINNTRVSEPIGKYDQKGHAVKAALEKDVKFRQTHFDARERALEAADAEHFSPMRYSDYIDEIYHMHLDDYDDWKNGLTIKVQPAFTE